MDFDIESVLREARFVHLTDQELVGYHDNELGSFPLARAKAHLKLCLICEQRSAAFAPFLEVTLPDAMPFPPRSVYPASTRRRSPTTRHLSIAVVTRQRINIHHANGKLTLGLIDFVINRLGRKSRSGDVQFTVRPLPAVLNVCAGQLNPIDIGKELRTDRVLILDCVRCVGQHISFTTDLIAVANRAELQIGEPGKDWEPAPAAIDSDTEKELRRINLKLTKAEQKRLAELQTSNPSADVEYTRGRFYLHRFPGSGLEKAIECFTKAVALNARFAEAYSGLADCFVMRGIYNISPPASSYRVALDHARKALRIDDDLAEAHTSLAYTYMCYKWDWAGAKDEYEKAIKQNSNYALAYQGYSHLLGALGKFNEAIKMSNLALAIDPVSPMIYVVRALIYYYAACDEKARQLLLLKAKQQCRQALSLNRRFDPAWYVRALVCVQLALTHRKNGRFKKAEKYFKVAVDAAKKARDFTGSNAQKHALLLFVYLMWGKKEEVVKAQEGLDEALANSYLSPYHEALIHVAKGETTAAFKSLEEGLRVRDQWMILVRYEPAFAVLHGDQRFKDLIRKLKIPSDPRR